MRRFCSRVINSRRPIWFNANRCDYDYRISLKQIPFAENRFYVIRDRRDRLVHVIIARPFRTIRAVQLISRVIDVHSTRLCAVIVRSIERAN